MIDFPELPDNQRWTVWPTILDHITVSLQERRWWGWRTIASHSAPASWGAHAIEVCVDMIERRDYVARLVAEHREDENRRRAEITSGKFRASGT